jgi:uncharacterized delta-60 repeat protein
VQLPAAGRGEVDEASAILIEPDGRIVVAGSRHRSGYGQVILIRLLTNGDIDQAFGSSGIIALSGRDIGGDYAVQVPLWRKTQLLRTDEGAYRVSVPYWCQVVGVTTDGTLDPAFGSSGTVQIDHPISNACSLMMAMRADGRLVVGASDGEAAVITRLLADGQPDPSYLAGTDPEDRVGHIITALAVGADGAIVFAIGLSDFGYHGLEIKRLLPSGEPDVSFGNAGSTKIEMPSEFGPVWLLFDMFVREDDSVVAAGGNPFASASHGPIIVRLLGADAGDSPGVLTFTEHSPLIVEEQTTDIYVEVGRTGGNAGQASVAYQVFADDAAGAATAGEDFLADAGRLEWEDGDATNRQIRVRIFDDDLPEDSERLKVLLTDAEGGAGLGRAETIVEIQANDRTESTTALSSTATTVMAGQSVTFTATVSGTNPTGTVTFYDGPTALGSPIALNSGGATFSTSALAVGSHDVTAAYSGDSNNAASTSRPVTVAVNATSGGGGSGGGGGGAPGLGLLGLLGLLGGAACARKGDYSNR